MFYRIVLLTLIPVLSFCYDKNDTLLVNNDSLLTKQEIQFRDSILNINLNNEKLKFLEESFNSQ